MRIHPIQSLLACFFVAILPQVLAGGDGMDPYLKETIIGRCYHNPPTKKGSADICPTLVGDLIGVFESHLDADIQATDFNTYIDKADFSSPPNKALFWLRFWGGDSNITVRPRRDLITPEETPGGAMVKDLVFCGVDQRYSCKKEESRAYWAFWNAAYAEFASQATGEVQIVVEPLADVQFLIASGISSLRKDQVTSVTIYALKGSCDASEPQKLMLSLRSAAFEVSCEHDVSNLVCGDDCSSTTDVGSEEPAEEDKNPTTVERSEENLEGKNKRRHPLLTFTKRIICLAVIVFLIYYLYKNGYIPSSWLRKIGWKPFNGGDYQQVSVVTNERIPLHNSSDGKDGGSIQKTNIVQ